MARTPASRRGRRKSRVVRKAPDNRAERLPESRLGGPSLPLTDHDAEAALVSGEHSGMLKDYFGEAQYDELRRLAKEAASREVRGGPRVLILPGIMGSTLGYDALIDDILWVDPLDIALGRLAKLSLSGGDKRISAVGVILLAYLAIRLRLRIAGFDASFHPYDWRRSLVDLGKDLAKRVKDEGRQVSVVAHSMGGLVARACLAEPHERLGRVVMLGTPNFGSFSPIEAFRGTHSVVKKVAFIDLAHSAEDLAGIFGTFPGLCQMMPSTSKYPADYFKLSTWPGVGARPSQTILDNARTVQQGLPSEHGDIVMIAGVNQDTIVDAKVENDEFVYTRTREGDGTVPLACALIPTARRTYYVAESHGSLPNNRRVQSAVIEILRTGETKQLTDTYQPTRGEGVRRVTEREARAQPYDGSPGRKLSVSERRRLIEEFAAPPSAEADAPATESGRLTTSLGATGADARSAIVVIGRREQRRLEVTLTFGSITEVEAGAYVLGLFPNVDPGGAVSAIDHQMNGAIGQMLARRMFNANVGEVTMIPTGRHPIRADVVAFAGLGAFDAFGASSGDVLELVGENIIRTFVSTRIDDFATVPIGGNSGEFNAPALRRLIAGFLRGLRDADGDQRFRGVTLCETDEARFDDLRRETYRLCGTTLFDGVEVTLREVRLPSAPAMPPRAVAPSRPQSVYLIVREEGGAPSDRAIRISASVLTAGAKAAISRETVEIRRTALDRHLAPVKNDELSFGSLAEFGRGLAHLVLPERIRTILERFPDNPLVVVHDAMTSRIPWELLHIGSGHPALRAGLSHRYEAANLSVAKWLEERQQGSTLDVLLVVNPTGDLAGATAEGERIKALLSKQGPSVRIEELKGEQANKPAILAALSSGEFDVIHYAGHAFFDPKRPANSGILCAGEIVLSGSELASLSNLPALVFFNACESGRLRKKSRSTEIDTSMTIAERVERGVGFAEAFLRGGVANYVGTYWPVGDDPAAAFAGVFYEQLLAGRNLGDAVMSGRKAVEALRSIDWADYIVYGDSGFQLKQLTPTEPQ